MRENIDNEQLEKHGKHHPTGENKTAHSGRRASDPSEEVGRRRFVARPGVLGSGWFLDRVDPATRSATGGLLLLRRDARKI